MIGNNLQLPSGPGGAYIIADSFWYWKQLAWVVSVSRFFVTPFYLSVSSLTTRYATEAD